MTTQEIKKFRSIIWSYYKDKKRYFPWRETTDPYKILVSEIMLQQTQTKRVVEKYNEFLKTFPSINDLAASNLPTVLKLWSGLGYNRRAKFLLESAQIIVSEHNSVLPSDLEKIRRLPGLGKATAASVLVFSYNLPLTFIETNIRRVYLHSFFPNQTNVADNDLEPLIAESLDINNPREWYFALMDYGVMLKEKEGINPNVRSKHYKKQTQFAGSLRQVRGAIIKLLLAEKHSTLKAMRTRLPASSLMVAKALNHLIAEHIVEKRKSTYRLAQ